MLINDIDHRRLLDVEALIHVYWPPSKDRELAIHFLEMVLHPNHCQEAGCSGCPGAADTTRTETVIPTAAPGISCEHPAKTYHL